MKILVTGASGFIGSNIVCYLSEQGYDIIATWNKNFTNVCLRKGVIYQKIDLSNKDEVSRLFSEFKFDACIHLAGPMKGHYVKDYLKNSVGTTENLLTFAEEYGVETFIYASSISVYGNTEVMVSESSDRVNLDDYATAKYICERLMEDSNIEKRIAIRLPRMVGKNMDLSAPWLPKLAANLMTNSEVKYFNPELPYNNLAHTDTLGRYIKKVLNHDAVSGKGYTLITIGATAPMKILEIIQHLKQGLNSSSLLLEIKENIPRNTCFCIDISRSIECGYEPWSVRETLDQFVKDLTGDGIF